MTEKQIATAIVVEMGRQAEAQGRRAFRVYGNEAGDLRAELPAGIELDVSAIARAILNAATAYGRSDREQAFGAYGVPAHPSPCTGQIRIEAVAAEGM